MDKPDTLANYTYYIYQNEIPLRAGKQGWITYVHCPSPTKGKLVWWVPYVQTLTLTSQVKEITSAGWLARCAGMLGESWKVENDLLFNLKPRPADKRFKYLLFAEFKPIKVFLSPTGSPVGARIPNKHTRQFVHDMTPLSSGGVTGGAELDDILFEEWQQWCEDILQRKLTEAELNETVESLRQASES